MIGPQEVPLPRLPLSMALESRSASTNKDARLVNAYIETLPDGTEEVVSRPGTVTFGATGAAAAASGLIGFNEKLYAVQAGNIYEMSSLGVPTLKGTTGTGQLSFSRTSQVPYLFMHNGSVGTVLNGSSGAVSAVSDTDFPPAQTPALPLASGAVYLDDMVFVMTTSGRIYNSAIEDPTTWGALDYISKISEPDGGVAIVKHLNFIVAFGDWSGEFFFNAGVATGSPLERSASYKMDIGCASGPSAIEVEQTVVWVGQAREEGRSVYMLEGVSPVRISNPPVERFLDASTLASVEANAIKIAGHVFYILTLNDLNITLVCDISEKRWYQWSTLSESSDIEWQYSQIAALNGTTYALDRATGEIDTIETTAHTDNGASIPFRVVTYKADLKDNKTKFFHHAEIIGNRSAATVQVRYSDDDYATWSTARSISINQERPVLRQLGQARRRAWELYSTSAVEIRLTALEFTMTKGTF